MTGFLIIGFFIGMQHALEADHLAAMGSMLEGRPGAKRNLVLRGAAWGLGHATTLFAVCAAVILMGLNLSSEIHAAMEFCVGVMLIVLGLDVLRRLWTKRIHFHVHTHGGEQAHIHAHSHKAATIQHRDDPHHHQHSAGFSRRAMAIGLVHGGAGSAGLLALAVASTQNPVVAIAYVVVFSAGALIGMATLTVIVAWPLGVMQRSAAWLHRALALTAAVFAIFLGGRIMSANAAGMREVWSCMS